MLMAECMVLRCQNPGDHRIELASPGRPLLECVMCDEHKRRIDAGEPWRYNADENVIYVGSDVPRRLVTWKTVENGDQWIECTLTLEGVDGGPETDVTLMLDPRQSYMLGSWLTMIGDPDAD